MAKFISTKTYPDLGPVAYRQWRDEGNCRVLHGYSLSFHFEFECDDLDSRNWCVDFGGLRPLKDKLEDWFDHRVLLAEDDPNFKDIMKLHELGIAVVHVIPKTGCEGLSDMLYEYINEIFLPEAGWGERVWCCKVEVRENHKNSAMRVGHRSLEDVWWPDPLDSGVSVVLVSGQTVVVERAISKGIAEVRSNGPFGSMIIWDHKKTGYRWTDPGDSH